jgi:hypothetical protein
MDFSIIDNKLYKKNLDTVLIQEKTKGIIYERGFFHKDRT